MSEWFGKHQESVCVYKHCSICREQKVTKKRLRKVGNNVFYTIGAFVWIYQTGWLDGYAEAEATYAGEGLDE